MLKTVLLKQKKVKYIVLNLVVFLIFMVIYTLIDSKNMSYGEMKTEYGLYLPILNIFLNIIMSSMSAMLISFSSALFDISGKDGKGSIFSGISVIFGILTYGCTPCVIAFFASIGISFTVAALPLAGLPYKFISLGLVLIGMLWLLYQIKHSKCSIQTK